MHFGAGMELGKAALIFNEGQRESPFDVGTQAGRLLHRPNAPGDFSIGLYGLLYPFSFWTGTYAACGFQIRLERKRIQYLVQVYLPSCMFVVVSWVSFLIKPEVVPGRMALLVT